MKTPTSKTPAAAIYVRIGRVDDDATASLLHQVEQARGFATELGIDLDDHLVYEDTGSVYGGNANPGYRALLDAIDGGEIHTVIATNADRLVRGTATFTALHERLKAAGVRLVTREFDTEAAFGEVMALLIASLADRERDVAKARFAETRADLATSRIVDMVRHAEKDRAAKSRSERARAAHRRRKEA